MEEILFTQEGQLGLITLNRPQALNALSLSMIQALYQQLTHWKEDTRVKAVVIRAVPGNAFCAGGDVRWLYHAGKNDNPKQMDFFWQEYRLNYLIHHFGKPYIALMDGVTMGGGVGIALHGSHPIASERFSFAMPETGIGFFPDVGASYLLSRCPESMGIYLGLTGHRLHAHEAFHLGLVRQILPSQDMTRFIECLHQADLDGDAHEKVNACLQAFSTKSSDMDPPSFNPAINSCFSQPSLEKIYSALAATQTEWAEKIKNILDRQSPLSLMVTLAQLHCAQDLSLAECLKMDFNLVKHFMKGHDFYEGVRALLVDKDKNPRWIPASIDEVTETMVADYFTSQGRVLEFSLC